MNKIFDSHSHYNDSSFKDDYKEVLKHIQDSGVGNVVNVGADIESARLAKKQAEENEFMYFSAGIHPHDAIQARDEAIMAVVSNSTISIEGAIYTFFIVLIHSYC